MAATWHWWTPAYKVPVGLVLPAGLPASWPAPCSGSLRTSQDPGGLPAPLQARPLSPDTVASCCAHPAEDAVCVVNPQPSWEDSAPPHDVASVACDAPPVGHTSSRCRGQRTGCAQHFCFRRRGLSTRPGGPTCGPGGSPGFVGRPLHSTASGHPSPPTREAPAPSSSQAGQCGRRGAQGLWTLLPCAFNTLQLGGGGSEHGTDVPRIIRNTANGAEGSEHRWVGANGLGSVGCSQHYPFRHPCPILDDAFVKKSRITPSACRGRSIVRMTRPFHPRSNSQSTALTRETAGVGTATL